MKNKIILILLIITLVIGISIGTNTIVSKKWVSGFLFWSFEFNNTLFKNTTIRCVRQGNGLSCWEK